METGFMYILIAVKERSLIILLNVGHIRFKPLFYHGYTRNQFDLYCLCFCKCQLNYQRGVS
jgi:hypothetical protein